MKYFLDTEFDGFGGRLLSLALVREDNESLYIIYNHNLDQINDPWVEKNVVPILYDVPSPLPGMLYTVNSDLEASRLIQAYLAEDDYVPYIITDWPDDVRYMCQAVITGPGLMINVPRLQFDVVRVDAYPTEVKGAVQHNAWWDAVALKHILVGDKSGQ